MSFPARVIVSVAVCALVGCGEVKLRQEPEGGHVPPADEPGDAEVPLDASRHDPPSMNTGDAAVQPSPSTDAGDPAPSDAMPPLARDGGPIVSEDDDAGASDPDPVEDAGAPEPPDLSCGAFASGMGLAACGSLQAWQAPALPYEGFAVERLDWLPIDGDEGYVALVTLKRFANFGSDGWMSLYRFDEQGTCVEHVGTIENAVSFYGAFLAQAVARGGTLGVSIAYVARFGTLAGIMFVANGEQVAMLRNDARMDVTTAGDLVIAQTPYREATDTYGLVLSVFDAEGTLVREAEAVSPGLIAALDASAAGEVAVMYKAPLGPGDWAEASRRIDRYGADLSLVGSWHAPEGVVLAALDVEGARVAVAGTLSETLTAWTQVLELPGWNAAWSEGAEAPGLEHVVDVDLTPDGRVLLVGSTSGVDTFDWLLGYQLNGSTLWSEPQRQAPARGLRAVSGQPNGHVLIDGPRGYCDLP